MIIGVISVRLEKRENIMVIGDGVNAAKLCKNLRKRLGFASLEILEDVKEETEDNYEANENPNTFASYTSSCEKCRDPDSCCCTILWWKIFLPFPFLKFIALFVF